MMSQSKTHSVKNSFSSNPVEMSSVSSSLSSSNDVNDSPNNLPNLHNLLNHQNWSNNITESFQLNDLVQQTNDVRSSSRSNPSDGSNWSQTNHLNFNHLNQQQNCKIDSSLVTSSTFSANSSSLNWSKSNENNINQFDELMFDSYQKLSSANNSSNNDNNAWSPFGSNSAITKAPMNNITNINNNQINNSSDNSNNQPCSNQTTNNINTSRINNINHNQHNSSLISTANQLATQNSSSIKSWAKIVSQQSPPSTICESASISTRSLSPSSTNQLLTSIEKSQSSFPNNQNNNLQSLNACQQTLKNQSKNSNFDLMTNQAQTNFNVYNNDTSNIISGLNSGAKKNPHQITNDNSKNFNESSTSQDWDLKVNQKVPWNLEFNSNSNSFQNSFNSNFTGLNQSNNNNNNKINISSNDHSSSAAQLLSNEMQHKLLNNGVGDSGTETWLNSNKNNNFDKNNLFDSFPNQTQSLDSQSCSSKFNSQNNSSSFNSNSINFSSINNNQILNSNTLSDTTIGSNPTVCNQESPLKQIKTPIEPSGWEDLDFKVAKKIDDGTSIWGDPENQRQVKVQKWSHLTKASPNLVTNNPVLNERDYGSCNKQSLVNHETSHGSLVGQTILSPITQHQNLGNSQSQLHQHQQSTSLLTEENSSKFQTNQQTIEQSLDKTSTALSILQSTLQNITNEQKTNLDWNSNLVNTKSWIKDNNISKNDNEWDSGRIDTSNWGINLIANKCNFDPSVGVVDTSKWSSSNSNQSSSINGSLTNGVSNLSNMSQQGVRNGAENGLPLFQQNGNPQNNNNINNSINKLPANGPRADQNDPRFKQNQPPNNLLQNQRMNGNLTLNPSNMTTSNNLQNQNKMMNNFQKQQPNQRVTPHNAANLNTNANNIPMGINSGQNNEGSAPIQNQLIESFQLAVSAQLISPDLLNIKLPPDVLSLLNHLFQTLNHYTRSENQINNLMKKRSQMPSNQFKNELDLLNQENQAYKENLVLLQKKINIAYLSLKQQQQSQNTNNNQQNLHSSSFDNSDFSSLQSSLLNSLSNNSNDVSGVSLSDMPIIKDQNSNQSKLLQLLHDPKSLNFINQSSNNQTNKRQLPHQITGNNQNSKFQQQQQVSFFQNFPSTSTSATPGLNQWSNLNNQSSDQHQIDDRITPFVPGKLWTGQGQQSIEDDPNCTPGSFNKPLLTETIDPESILSSLQRPNQWSNSLGSFDLVNNNNVLNNVDLTNLNQMSNNNSRLSNYNNRTNSNINSTWTSNNNSFMPTTSYQNQNNFNSNINNNLEGTTIAEQLWGVKSNFNRVNNFPANLNQNNLNRNSNNFNQNLMSNHQQQQAFKNNSGNVNTPSQQQFNFNNSNNMNNSVSVNGGHFLLICNITPQTDQSTLRALCGQYANGQLTYFKYIPNKSCVIVRYTTKEETNNAHVNLNSILLGNTTISTQILTENDLKYI